MIGDLDQRSGWPEELKTLLARHPRETWAEHGTPMAQFWLERHDEFRRHAAALRDKTVEYHDDDESAEKTTVWIAPRLQGFLGALHGHHQIEDFHYFPAFREAHKELASGFDALASDHELLHQNIVDIVGAFNALLDIVRADRGANPDALKRASLAFVGTSERMFRRLNRHLDDEEDLIIPVMLARD